MIETGQTTISAHSAWGLDTEPADNYRARALCAQVGDEFWFPEKGGSTKEAKKICFQCEVRAECLQDALDHDERFGIWGGLSERDRRRLKKGDLTVLKPPKPLAHCEVCDKPLYSQRGATPSRVCSETCRSVIRDRSQPDHGTLAMYKRGCHCPPCCDANTRYMAKQRRPDGYPTRSCLDCGDTFQPEHGSSRYCSVKCRKRAADQRYRTAHQRTGYQGHDRECVGCGTVFQGHHKAKYCSEDCRRAARTRPVLARAPKARAVECQQCGHEFMATHRCAKYCSGRCRTKACTQRKANAA